MGPTTMGLIKTMFANLANGPFSYDGVDNHEIKRSFTPIE
jgi:hypothetical protein